MLANGRIHMVAKRGRLLNARAGVSPQMNFELAGIDGGEKVLAEPGNEDPQGGQRNRQEQNEEDLRMVDTESQQAHVSAAKLLKARLERELKHDERIAAGVFAGGAGVVVL